MHIRTGFFDRVYEVFDKKTDLPFHKYTFKRHKKKQTKNQMANISAHFFSSYRNGSVKSSNRRNVNSKDCENNHEK